ncbi:hypothetical protein IUY40_09390 [Flavobacterium sp. ALJ2]|uniref:hypothetical protein n=1 Tax=Flavobacterium sp. ALJ2 TaxID=2786960 RepID=UPI00189ED441|nr:hypothetical protein [Flavobacterium sp. ALJ2]MBF7091755.1 hypothetical protein [Flavobacterium sp. ALJ2]
MEGRGFMAVNNFKAKTVKFAKEATKYYGQFEVLKEMKEMIPMLSSNEKFNMPSLSTFVGFIPQLQVIAFGVEAIGWMVKESLKESEEVVDESMWADWQNAKCKGLKYAQDFIQSSWARKKNFQSQIVSKETVDQLLRGKSKTLKELTDLNINDFDSYKNYTLIHYKTNDENTEKTIDIVDSIFINDEQ